ncbi:MAG: MBL fold metallo-hydrolase, partial [Pseudomonadales bacterium]|nr:MBL fold metallo-hydrolase [Pseudomonadales bacterium]
MRFASLGSGSRGNATIVEQGETCILVDCGFTLKETVRRLARLGKVPEDIDAILITHEHGDHVRGAPMFAKKHGTQLWMTQGTFANYRHFDGHEAEFITVGEPFGIKDIEVRPVAVPHDAIEPCQFLLSDGDINLGILTDLGKITQQVIEHFIRCDALLLECNHDLEMLQKGSYPASLIQRVAGDFGHLNNQQSADFLASIDHSWLQHLAIAHVSEKNNCLDKAKAALISVLHCPEEYIDVADQELGLDWRRIQ